MQQGTHKYKLCIKIERQILTLFKTNHIWFLCGSVTLNLHSENNIRVAESENIGGIDMYYGIPHIVISRDTYITLIPPDIEEGHILLMYYIFTCLDFG